MPRRMSDYPDAFTGWNFISSIGSLISVAATVLFLHIVYLQLVKGKAIFGYPWAVPQLFSDYLRILKDKSAPGLEWALHNPPKPHAFTSLPLQSSTILSSVIAAISTLFTVSSEFLCDAPRAWGLYFQDSASPQMEALIELHDNIMYYLVAILFSVGWIQGAIIKNFDSAKSPISNKYLNHGKNVPIQKCYKNKFSNYKRNIRTYSTLPANFSKNVSYIKVYDNAYDMRKDIYKENKDKSGIYMFTNRLTNDTYIGQSQNLANRFRNYFNISYLKHKYTLVISRALIKYGFSNFSITILEYCEISDLVSREQYYFDMLNPKYNTLKIAGSSLTHKHSEETKMKISDSLKGIYVKEKSALYGRTASDETKRLMSINKSKENNPLFGKTHNKSTIDLMKHKALGRTHNEETKLKMSLAKGNPIYIYEKSSSEGFKLIGSFVSARRAATFLEISGSTIIKYRNSGEIYKNRYRFSSKLIT